MTHESDRRTALQAQHDDMVAEIEAMVAVVKERGIDLTFADTEIGRAVFRYYVWCKRQGREPELDRIRDAVVGLDG